MKKIRSPLFYVGDKYKLMPQLNKLFPNNINTFFDVFAGGGSASLNTNANKYILNDLDSHIIELHEYLSNELQNLDSFINHEIKIIDSFGLSHSAEGVLPDNIIELKEKYKKTYFSKANKVAYNKLRDSYNNDQDRLDLFYLLLVFGFNHMTRFNNEGKFNLPVGNVDWNNNVEEALGVYSSFVKSKCYSFKSLDFEEFVTNQNIEENDFLYFDPPYSIALSEYNKMWDSFTDDRLFKLLDRLDANGFKWGLSNVFSHKGRTNNLLKEWAAKYHVYPIKANYISRFDNTIKEDTKEVYVTNIS